MRERSTAIATIRAITVGEANRIDEAVLAGLIDSVLKPVNAWSAVAAIRALQNARHPELSGVICHALTSVSAAVRAAALDWIAARGALQTQRRSDCEASDIEVMQQLVARMMRCDTSWNNRRRALRIRLLWNEPLQETFYAASDPHWRVRNEVLNDCLDSEISIERLDDLLDGWKGMRSINEAQFRRAKGVVEYLRFRVNGTWSPDKLTTKQSLTNAERRHPFCVASDGPAVIAREILACTAEQQVALAEELVSLIDHSDERVRNAAAGVLLLYGLPRHLAGVAQVLHDPRAFGFSAAEKLLNRLGDVRRLETARVILQNEDACDAAVAWARRQLDPNDSVGPAAMDGPSTNAARREVVARELTRQWVSSEDSGASNVDMSQRLHDLQRDPHPLVRIAAMTPERAAELIDDPSLETSWLVLEQAARLAGVAFTTIATSQLRTSEAAEPPDSRPNPAPALIDPIQLPDCIPVPFGRDQVPVSRMGLSGHYLLPTVGFHAAVDAGINLLFWEPNYDTLNAFAREIPPARRNELHVIAGSFAADADGVERDVHRALRNLGIERISLFLMFWVRSWRRLNDEVVERLHQLQADGKIREFSLSTHNRTLACDAIDARWNPLMVRHSLAHRGAEDTVFPALRCVETTRPVPSTITFNNTCYGRLFRQVDPKIKPPSPAECYRYSLDQPAVTTCLTAPSTVDQLRENLKALDTSAEISAERRAELRRHGDRIYEQDSVFRQTVRGVS